MAFDWKNYNNRNNGKDLDINTMRRYWPRNSKNSEY